MTDARNPVADTTRLGLSGWLAATFQANPLTPILALAALLIGFTAAISLVIIAAQLPNLMGLTGVTTTTFQTTNGRPVSAYLR